MSQPFFSFVTPGSHRLKSSVFHLIQLYTVLKRKNTLKEVYIEVGYNVKTISGHVILNDAAVYSMGTQSHTSSCIVNGIQID